MNLKLCMMCCLVFFEENIPNKVFNYFYCIYYIYNKILFIFLIINLYGYLLYKYNPYKLELYNRIDIYSIIVIGFSIYLGFIAYVNKESLFCIIVILLIIGVTNIVFIFWCFKQLLFAYLSMIK